MRHFLRLIKSITLLSCATLPIVKYRLTEDNSQPKTIFETIS